MSENTNKLIFSSSESSSDLLYTTGFQASDPFSYFEVDGVKFAVMNSLELQRAKNESKSDVNILDYSEIIPEQTERNLKGLFKYLVNKYPSLDWHIPTDFPCFYADMAREIGMKIKCENIELFPKRSRKTPDEIDFIRYAMNVTMKAMRRAENILRESDINAKNELIWNSELLTSEILKREINIECIKCGAVAKHTIVAGGLKSAVPHDTGSGTLYAHEPVVIDIFPRVEKTGYWGDMTRTFVRGKASDIVKKAYHAVYLAKEGAMKEVMVGAIPEKLHALAVDIMKSKGFKTGKDDIGYYGFIHSLGHGVGLDIHENPKIGPKQTKLLELGEIFTIEPGLYYREWGGIRLEDMVLVTKNGFESFTDYECTLEL